MAALWVRIQNRICDQIACPNCSVDIRYTTLHLKLTPRPFMYCQECSNVLLRECDLAALDKVLTGTSDITSATLRFYEDLEQNAPACPCGGRFTLWANVKCPHCGWEFPYNEGVQDPNVRVHDNMVVVLEGAVVLIDLPSESWRCGCSK